MQSRPVALGQKGLRRRGIGETAKYHNDSTGFVGSLADQQKSLAKEGFGLHPNNTVSQLQTETKTVSFELPPTYSNYEWKWKPKTVYWNVFKMASSSEDKEAPPDCFNPFLQGIGDEQPLPR